MGDGDDRPRSCDPRGTADGDAAAREKLVRRLGELAAMPLEVPAAERIRRVLGDRGGRTVRRRLYVVEPPRPPRRVRP